MGTDGEVYGAAGDDTGLVEYASFEYAEDWADEGVVGGGGGGKVTRGLCNYNCVFEFFWECGAEVNVSMIDGSWLAFEVLLRRRFGV